VDGDETNKRSLRTRMLASLMVVLSAGVILAAYSAWNAARMSGALKTAVTSTAIKLDPTNALRQRAQEMAASQRGAWIAWSSGEQDKANALVEKFAKAAARTHE
jgi:hypothetical protein